MTNISIGRIDETLSGDITQGQGGPYSNGKEVVPNIPSRCGIIEDTIMLFRLIYRTLVGGVLPMCRDAVDVFSSSRLLSHL